MVRQPICEKVESLRVTLNRLEQNAEPDGDAANLAELKRILLKRIAELEAEQALKSNPPAVPDAAALIPLPPIDFQNLL